jgi:L-amino acid N-acyltransferase YncA
MPSGDTLLVGRDAGGIGAVSWWFQVHGPGVVKIQASAVALRLRKRGLGCGDELMSETLDGIASQADAAGEDHVMVTGSIHRQNRASQALADRHGFFYTQDSDDLQEWWLRINIEQD